MATDDADRPGRNRLLRLLDFRELVIIVIILAAGTFLHFQSKDFLSFGNLSSVFLYISTQSVVAIGMTVLLVSGGFDLSVGSVAGLTGAVTAICLKQAGLPVPFAILAGLALGAAIGTANGLIIAKLGINAFVTTLGMMGIARGALQVVAGGQSISGLPASFKAIGQGTLGGVQYPILISIALIGVGDILLRKSRFFRQSYYIGGNEKAAVLSGIPVNRVKVFNYALTGFLAAVAGIIMTARFGSISATAGSGLELEVITAVIIGGASLQGGEGTVLGSFLGCILMALIVNAETLLSIDINWNELIIGATLLVAVLIDTIAKRRRGGA
jgi:ribose transport system permease protein